MYEIEEMIRKTSVPMNVDDFIAYAKGKQWVNYCDCVIDDAGMVYELRGGHSQMLAVLAANKLGVSMTEYWENMPREYWSNTGAYASHISKVLEVRYGYTLCDEEPNDLQKITFDKLVKANLVCDKLIIGRENKTINFEQMIELFKENRKNG